VIIKLGLPRQGIYLSRQESEDYLSLWRLVALYVGAPTEPFETLEKAELMMESTLESEIRPNEISKVLASSQYPHLRSFPPV
jgi:hypothetical protein